MNLSKLLLCLLIIPAFCVTVEAQFINGTDTLFGYEWIDYNKSYFKLKVAEDGIYKFSYNDLANAGVFNGISNPEGQHIFLYKNGESVPLHITQIATFSTNDYITFVGKKNRGEIDKYLYEDSTYQLNPMYSLFTDTSAYYLVYDNAAINQNLISEIPNDLANLPTKEAYCWQAKELDWQPGICPGIDRGGSGFVSAKYDYGEGFTRPVFALNQSVVSQLGQRHNAAGLSAQYDIRILGTSGTHHAEVKINNTTYVTDTFSNWGVRDYQILAPMNTLNYNAPVKVTGSASNTDRYRIAYVKIKYPRKTKFDNLDAFYFQTDSSWQKKYFEIENFTYGSTAPILYNTLTNERIVTQISGNKILVTIPPSTTEGKFVLVGEAGFKTSAITPVSFNQFDPNQTYDYIILTHSKLFDDGNGFNHVQDYANYRMSTTGGAYNPVIIDIDDVYEQFGYGIDRHEQSIRNFVQWAYKNWNSKYLFILGKGVYYAKYRNVNIDFTEYDLVPSFGYPTSDNLLAAKPNTSEPVMAVGRVAAYTPDMVRIYLDKVKEMELAYSTAPQTIEDRAWMKNFLHLGGGDVNIQDFIKGRLQGMEDSISQSQFGANVLAYYKNSTNVIQNVNSEDVTNRINEGLAWITFFGHSAPNTLDFDIGEPTQYDNQGKYPMIYAMGCNTNRLLESSSTLSETYVFVEDRGAIGFIGSTATTSLSDLNEYGKVLYKNLGNDHYGESIGNILKATVEEYPLTGFWGELVKHNIFLHGDPAVRIYPNVGVDYIVNQKTAINPNFINVQVDSFQLNLVVSNIGYAVEDSINVLVEQEYPSGEKVILGTYRIESPKFENKYSIWLSLDNKDIVGNNFLHITLDSDNEVSELPASAESNNTAIIPFSIISNSATPIYPYEYSIVTTPNIELKASTSNILTDNLNYYIELDTTKTFDSPIKMTTQKVSNGGILKWNVNTTLQDSVVYYWRISIDSTTTNGGIFDWKYSSFVYIPQSWKGWNQSHFYQHTANNYLNTAIDSTTYQQIFSKRTKELKLKTGAFPTLLTNEPSLSTDGFIQFTYWPCPNNKKETFQIAVFEPNSLDFVVNDYNNAIAPNCWQHDLDWYIFDVYNTAERQKMVDTLLSIPSDYYVAMFVTKNATGSLFSNQWAADSITSNTNMNIFRVLEDQGARKIRDMVNNETPYILIYQKDNLTWSGFREVKAATNTDIIEATTFITGKQTEGAITSVPIGPAKSWGDIKWEVTDYNFMEDSISLDVIGVDVNGDDNVLAEGLTNYNISLDFVNASIYPYLKLRYNVKDETSLTPAQLRYWRVFYQSYPDAALNPQEHLVFYSDTIQQGDDFKFEIGVENVSDTDMDSLLVKYIITNSANQETNTLIRNEPLLGDSSIVAKLSIDTRNRIGDHLINIEINPNDDQPEMYKFNNIGVTNFYIEEDKTAPILDVTFDGLHIMSGDIISSKPNILIALEDENPFIALDDTSTFELYVVSPAGVSSRYYVDNQTVIFRPADNNDLENKNRAEIEFLPEFTEDGTYQLQVKAKDATNNLSGANQYKIDFEVITKAMISNVLNYPNPFSTSTQFVFTLTGAEIPEAMNIQIMTVSGKVVKTITKEELGNINMGLNRTEYTWDGTDDFGNRLANGVYLYRVDLKSTTEETYELFNTGTNDYFKGGFGKMVILR